MSAVTPQNLAIPYPFGRLPIQEAASDALRGVIRAPLIDRLKVRFLPRPPFIAFFINSFHNDSLVWKETRDTEIYGRFRTHSGTLLAHLFAAIDSRRFLFTTLSPIIRL